MNKEKNSRKISGICLVLGMVLIGEIVWLFWNSGIVKGLNGRADNLRIYAKATRDDETILPGDVYDRNGTVLVQTERDADTSCVTTTYRNSMAYAQLLGFTGRHTFNPNASSTEDVIGTRNDARLLAFLDEDYWGEKGALYNTTSLDGTKGQSAILTIDDDLQNQVYQTLCNYMSPTGEIGSAVVMDVKTGAILADVCFPTYDYNDLAGAQEKMQQDETEKNLEPGYPVTYKSPQTPGSIFKVLTAVAMLDHGMGDYTVANTSFTMDSGWTCNAVPYHAGSLSVDYDDTLDMETALNVSSNVYFAKAALELGADGLNETAEKFMLRNDSQELLLDFGNVRYNWDTDVSDEILAQTGFGQGRTELTTIQAAMIMQAIANDGVLLKPYIVEKLVDADGKTVYRSDVTKLSDATSKKTADIVTGYLRSTAEECCKLHGLETERSLFEKYGVVGKTGTAETGDANATTNAWYISFAPEKNPRYVVVVNQCKTDHKQGYRMIPAVAEIYNYLFTTYEQ